MTDSAPSSADLLLGGARVFFDDGTGFRDLGNIPELSLSRAVSELEHYTTRSGKRLLDKTLITETKLGLNFKIDNFDALNLNDILYGGGVADASYTAGSAVDEAHTTPSKLDRYLFTVKNNISNVVVTGTSGTPTYVKDTDYEETDLALGIIKIISGGTITASLAIEIDYDYTAGTRNKVQPGKTFTIEGSARLEFLTQSGSPLTWVIYKAALKVEGDTDLSSENWSVADMKIEILSDDAGNPTEPYGYVLEG